MANKKKSATKAPTKGTKKPTATSKRKTTTPAKRGGNALQKKPSAESIFAGATEISLTENKIAVTRSTAKSASGKYSEKTTRDYHDRTPANMKAFREAVSTHEVKKVTVKLKEEKPRKFEDKGTDAKKSAKRK